VERPRILDSGSFAARTSLVLAAIAAIAVLFLPLGEAVTEDPADPAASFKTERTTLLTEEGPWVLGLAAFPVVLAAIPVIGERVRPGSRALRIVAAAALWLFVVAGLASIGWFFAPSSIAMTLAAAARRPRAPQQG
jgi:cytochrome bd-type quinol oxidase subunit 2